jgi:hypothetical protein
MLAERFAHRSINSTPGGHGSAGSAPWRRLALAEWLDTDLVTADQRLVRAAGPLCPVRLVGDRPNG